MQMVDFFCKGVTLIVRMGDGSIQKVATHDGANWQESIDAIDASVNGGVKSVDVEQCGFVLPDQFRGETHVCEKCGAEMYEGFGAVQGNAVWRWNDTRLDKFR